MILKDAELLVMGASKFRPSDDGELFSPLYATKTEAEFLQGLWKEKGKFIFDEEIKDIKDMNFTKDKLDRKNRGKPRIIHIASHAKFASGDKYKGSYIQFSDEPLWFSEILEKELDDPLVDLLVLSACSTALGSKEAELGFAGVAFQAGVKSILGSLWEVNDVSTFALMSQFYTFLQEEKDGKTSLKAEALREAQLAMINGEIVIENGELKALNSTNVSVPLPEAYSDISIKDLYDPYFWAGFTIS